MRVGRHEMHISDTAFIMSSKNTPGVVMNGTIEDESVKATIWISEASAWMAHKALKNCGFDSEKQDLDELKKEPRLLGGNTVVVNVTHHPEYGMKVEIALDVEPNKAELTAANGILKGLHGAAPAAPVSSPF